MTHTDNSHKEIIQIITRLNGAIVNIRLYSMKHPQIQSHINILYQGIKTLLVNRQDVTLIRIDDELIFDKRSIRSGKDQIIQFVSILKSKGIEHISFMQKLEKSSLTRFLRELASTDKESVKSHTGIKIGRVEIKSSDSQETEVFRENLREHIHDIKINRDIMMKKVMYLHDDMKNRKSLDTESINKIVSFFLSGLLKCGDVLDVLAPLKSTDDYTFTHVVNVCILTMSQAENLGFTGEHLYQIGVAATLHDTGKHFIPHDIINKPGKLTVKERKIIEKHSTQGASYLLGLNNISKLAILGALEHHMKYDGTGYPIIKDNWQTNIVSQMIAISDVFDAMRSRRSYKEPVPQEKILKTLYEEKGRAFNPYLVNKFIQMISRQNSPSFP